MRKAKRHQGRAIRRQARQDREFLAFLPITLQWVRAYVAGDHAEATRINRRRGDMILALIRAGQHSDRLAPTLRRWERAEEIRLGY